MFTDFKIYPQNLILVLVLLLPNMLLMFFPAVNMPAENSRPSAWHIVIMLERLGQAAVFILPMFFSMSIEGRYQKYALAVMIASAIIYYICWGRFFLQGRTFSLMYQSIFCIPIPMALFPVLYFAAAAILMDSWVYGGAVLIFAAGHIIESIYVSMHL